MNLFTNWAYKCPRCKVVSQIPDKYDPDKYVKNYIGECGGCGFTDKGGGQLIPGVFKPKSADGYTGPMILLDNFGKDQIFVDPYGGYTRTTSILTDKGYPAYICPISKKLIKLIDNTRYPGKVSDPHHTIYNSMNEYGIGWKFGEYIIHIHPEVHEQIHYGKRLRDIHTESIVKSIDKRNYEHSHLAVKIDGFDYWDNSYKKKRDMIYLNALHILWKYMEEDHKYYPKYSPSSDDIQFGLLRCGVPPHIGVPKSIFEIYGLSEDSQQKTDREIDKILWKWKQVYEQQKVVSQEENVHGKSPQIP